MPEITADKKKCNHIFVLVGAAKQSTQKDVGVLHVCINGCGTCREVWENGTVIEN